MRFFFKVETHIVRAEKALIVAFIALMITFSFLQLALRILFHSGIVWLDPALRHMVLWTGLTGAALASRYSGHFALDALIKFLPERSHRPLNVFTGIFTVVVAGALFGAARKFIRDEFSSGSVAFYIGNLGIKGGWAGIILPAVFLLIAFHALMNIFRPEERMTEAMGHKP
jgi:TRAP-type C4-dicarboxylate transport system permease small subunit